MLEYRVVRGYLRKQSEEVQLRDRPAGRASERTSEPECALAIESACCILTVSRALLPVVSGRAVLFLETRVRRGPDPLYREGVTLVLFFSFFFTPTKQSYHRKWLPENNPGF